MEKRFIIIDVHELGDQFECDADRVIDNQLYTLAEVKAITEKEVWQEHYGGDRFNTKEELIKDMKAVYKEGRECGWIDDYDNFEDWLEDAIACNDITREPVRIIEVYEIKGDKLVKRDDLSNYEC